MARRTLQQMYDNGFNDAWRILTPQVRDLRAKLKEYERKEREEQEELDQWCDQQEAILLAAQTQ